MRKIGKYLVPCTCGATRWQANKSVKKTNDKGTYTTRYRTCLECGRHIKTIQWDGEPEICMREAETMEKVHKERLGLKAFCDKVNQVEEKKPLKLNLYSSGKMIHIDKPMDEDEALRLIGDFFGGMSNG
jgi:hypothetical protein